MNTQGLLCTSVFNLNLMRSAVDTTALWFAAQAHWHVTTYPKGLDNGWRRRTSAFLDVAVLSILPSHLSKEGKCLACAPAGWPTQAKDSQFSLVSVLWAWTLAIHGGDRCIRSSSLPGNEIRALVSVKCSWITNAVGIEIAEAGKEFIHSLSTCIINHDRSSTGKYISKAECFYCSSLIISSHRDSQRIPSRAFRSTKEALKQCFVLYALEGKVIIKASQRCSKTHRVSCNKYAATSCGYAEHPIPLLRLAVRLTLSAPAHPHTPSSFAWFKNWMLSSVSACPKGLKDGNKAALSEKENVEQCLRPLCQATLSQKPLHS